MRSELKQNAKIQLKGNLWLSIAVLVVYQLVSYVPNLLGMLSESAFLAGIISIITVALTGVLSIGVCRFFINLTGDSNSQFSDLWYGFNNILKACGVTLLVGVIVFLGSLFFVVPGIILAYMYSQVYYVMAQNPELSVVDVLKESARIMKGHKFELFVLQLSFLGWMILSGLTFGIVGFYVIPYYNATLANYYLSIK